MTSEIAVLLPARNAANELASYFACVSRFADFVIALDDGSTDSTLDILEKASLVKAVLRNPPRDSFDGWNDGENRNRLLNAVSDFHPRWILSLDADERLEASDCEALLRFLSEEARVGFAYGLQMHRMIRDDRCFDLNNLWNFRLFAYRPGYHLPKKRMHFQPVPIEIPKERRIRTTLRIQHFAGADTAKRQARFDKYAVVDPRCQFQKSYANLLMPVKARHLWQIRRQWEMLVVDPK